MNLDAIRWRTQAIDDLDTALILFNSGRYGPCAFFCQQAAEKALKAALYQAGERPWGHSVSSLLDQMCAALRIDPADAPHTEAQALDEHYMRPRYPDARTEVESEYDVEIAQDALQEAHTMLAFVRKGLADVGEDTDNQATANVG